MSLKVLLDDQIDKLFEDNPELCEVGKNKFEIAVTSFANLNHLHGLDFDDLIDGIMGKGGDEGIDLCYVFCNGNLVRDEEHPINKENHIKIKFFQVKKENGFSTNGFKNLKEGIEQIFDLDLSLDELKKNGANQEYLDKAELIRKIFRKANKERAKFSCEVFYATISDSEDVSEKILKLQNDLKSNPLNIQFDFEYWGAQKLLDMTERVDEELEIKFNSQPLEIKERDVDTSGFAGFISGKSLIESLLDDDNEFRSHLTEGNVRFFLGEDKKINQSIIETATDDEKLENFWAMNNGLTIVGDAIEPLGNNEYTILNPQIVNGCQTVHCLYYAYKENNTLSKKLNVFVKLVNTSKLEVQTDIISATNSQNPVKTASLKANDNIQRNIEKHLKESGIYYERRENYYKRQGFTGNKVIGLLKMAQIIHSVVNKSSVEAANDTSKLFETEGKYNSIFNVSADYDIYKYATILFQKIWTLKNSDIRRNDYPDKERTIISKGGFALLNVMSSLIMSKAIFKSDDNEENKNYIGKIDISLPIRKNEFSKRKDWILKKIFDDVFLENIYNEAKQILFSAAKSYEERTGKQQVSLFKYRKFDYEYLRIETEGVLTHT
jgi:hypothetical protein